MSAVQSKSRETLENLIKEARTIILNGGHPGDSVVDQWLADTEGWHKDIPGLEHVDHIEQLLLNDSQADTCLWDDDPDEGFKHYWRTACGNYGSREAYKSIPAKCPHCERPTQSDAAAKDLPSQR
jgi:hypothetical protein